MEPNPLAIFLLCLAGAGGLVFLLWLNHKLATRGRPKSEEAETPAIASRPIAEEAPEITPSVIAQIMSTLLGSAGPIATPARPLPATGREAGQGVAKPCQGVNTELPGNMLPEEIREVMRFWAKVEAAEQIIAGGKIGQVEAVELIFNCKRSGRADSIYGRAVAAIKARSEAAYRKRQAQLVELQAAAAAQNEV
jgi:hypothetical protein